MTDMRFPFGDEAACIDALLAGYRFRPMSNHRGQLFYQGRRTWKGQPVICRLGVGDLSHLPRSLYEEIWIGYYDAAEPDSMLDDETHANILACVKKAFLTDAP
ncbi:hypothetical protein [Solidesulfovibrio sp.]|uniref:hypothetical protein n=1 Tax=Solidesulfovibrio sp. TaxID=2910990 RepID=UPI002B1FC839|nr:hypothetical protein [Solidesulfovibrio sp.]MEA5088355.1 hypothetical protein [Solidesulfovibrio sp.]